MIKFFRKIRQNLLSEEKKLESILNMQLEKSILVVIGILIAFQINNWNEQQKDPEANEIKLLNNVQKQS